MYVVCNMQYYGKCYNYYFKVLKIIFYARCCALPPSPAGVSQSEFGISITGPVRGQLFAALTARTGPEDTPSASSYS